MDEKFSKSAEELGVYFENYCNHVIPLFQICNMDQNLNLLSYLQQFLMCLLYKAGNRLPFDDPFYTKFSLDSLDTLVILGFAKRFRNIILMKVIINFLKSWRELKVTKNFANTL